jgi:hypothetical protein
MDKNNGENDQRAKPKTYVCSFAREMDTVVISASSDQLLRTFNIRAEMITML